MLDTSIIIDGIISNKIDSNEINEEFEIIIPRLAIDELQSQACKQREHGFVGLAQLRKMREKCKVHNIGVRIAGGMPTLSDIKLAKNGRIDALICAIAEEENAILFTSDYIQYLTALASGVQSIFDRSVTSSEFDIENYFDQTTMSVHLIEGVEPLAKKGSPGNFSLEKISQKKLSKDVLDEIINFLFSTKDNKKISNIEITFDGCYVCMSVWSDDVRGGCS